MSVLHMVPFLIIIALAVWNVAYQRVTKNKLSFDVSPVILLLSSIGIASGFGVHNHSGEEVAGACYFCFGYAAVLAIVAYGIMQRAKIIQKVKA